LSYISFSKSS